MHSRATDGRSASQCEEKWPDQPLRPPFALPEGLAVVHTSRQSCRKAGKARIFTPVREPSRESQLIRCRLRVYPYIRGGCRASRPAIAARPSGRVVLGSRWSNYSGCAMDGLGHAVFNQTEQVLLSRKQEGFLNGSL
jgi:hypothetical protein